MTDRPHVLVVNAGSSSLKYQLIDATSGRTVAVGLVSEIGGASHHRHEVEGHRHDADVHCPTHTAAFALARAALGAHGPGPAGGDLVAVGHRVVHGGRRFTQPVLVDDGVVEALRDLAPLAPLHNPANVEGIVRAQEAFPGLPHVAVFDTGFHATLPEAAHTYAVPRAWRERHDVRRYGFHGSSYAWVSRRTAELMGRDPSDLAMVVLHLGNGASACAVDGGRSVETSMGLSPAEGLVMGTRSGDVDPALGGYLARVAGLSAQEYDRALNRDSGLLGLAGVSDFRELSQRREDGDADAGLAFDVTVHRIRKYVGAYAAVLGRLDALVFTGGIGERSAALRAAVVDGLGVLGLHLDAAANADGPAERRVSDATSSAPVWVVPTDEEREIARAALEVLGLASAL
ncbi:acetate kinase [Fodinibacter luteus]|uniref:Acetate kinase n=1 Tax=Fodinibacter luteus TaxID=552064 RepID=A0ABP8KEA6_9MICO